MLAIKLGLGLKKIRLAPAARRVSRGRILGHREWGGVCVRNPNRKFKFGATFSESIRNRDQDWQQVLQRDEEKKL